MKNLCLTIIFAVFSSPVFADWELLESSSIGNLYINNAKTKIKGNIVRVWTLISFNKPEIIDNQKTFQSRAAIAEYDCKNRYTNLFALYSYSNPNGTGAIVEEQQYVNKEWLSIRPNTLIDKVYTAVCKV